MSDDRDGPSKLVSVQRCQDSCLVTRDMSRFSSRLGREIGMPLKVRWENQVTFQLHRDIRIPILSCQMEVRPPVKMRRGTRAFSRVSTGDSDIPSSSEMKDEHTFKSLQGNPALFQVRLSYCTVQLRQQSQGPSHIPIDERSLLLRCLWKVGIPLESKPGIQLSSQYDLGYMELFSICCAELCDPLDLGWCSQEISRVAKRKSSHLLCLMGNARWLWSQCRGIGPHLELIWGTQSSFMFLL